MNCTTYRVYVGNIGLVYDGLSHADAQRTYEDYKQASEGGVGRAAGEPVTMFCDDDIMYEHKGANHDEG